MSTWLIQQEDHIKAAGQIESMPTVMETAQAVTSDTTAKVNGSVYNHSSLTTYTGSGARRYVLVGLLRSLMVSLPRTSASDTAYMWVKYPSR